MKWLHYTPDLLPLQICILFYKYIIPLFGAGALKCLKKTWVISLPASRTCRITIRLFMTYLSTSRRGSSKTSDGTHSQKTTSNRQEQNPSTCMVQ